MHAAPEFIGTEINQAAARLPSQAVARRLDEQSMQKNRRLGEFSQGTAPGDLGAKIDAAERAIRSLDQDGEVRARCRAGN